MSKNDELVACLKEGWQSVVDLQSRFGWQPHTIRGAISTLARKRGIVIERVRSPHGVTSYRAKPEGEAGA